MTIPKLSEIQPLAGRILAKSFGTNIKVIVDDGKKQDVEETELREKGCCVTVSPVLHWTSRDQSGPAFCVDVEIMVKVQFSPEVNDSDSGAGLDIMQIVMQATTALANTPDRHPGGEFFKLAKDAGTMSKFDDGLWVYDLVFTKEAMI